MSPSINHSYLCKKILLQVEQSEEWEAWPELTLNIETGLIPDIAVFRRGSVKPDFYQDAFRCDLLPQLAIEVASPSQTIHDLMQKAEKFLAAGVPAVWTIEPYGRTIYVSTPHHREVKLSGVVEHGGIKVDFSLIFGEHEQLRNSIS